MALPEPRRLSCPPIAVAQLQEPIVSVDVRAIRALGMRYQAPASTFGLELKVAYALEAGGEGGDRLRRVYYRPAQEPILWSWWTALQRVPLDPDETLALASVLAGEPVDRRAREMASRGGGAGGEDLLYETPERSQTWRADIAAADAADATRSGRRCTASPESSSPIPSPTPMAAWRAPRCRPASRGAG